MTRKATKILDNSTIPKDSPKDRRYPDAAVTERDLLHFTTKLIEWARDNEDALDPMEFVMKWGIPSTTYWEWVNKHALVAQADSEACEYIGLRRDRLWLKGKHVSGADKYLPAFKSRYRKYQESVKRLDAELVKDKISHQASENSKLSKETGFYLPVIKEDE